MTSKPEPLALHSGYMSAVYDDTNSLINRAHVALRGVDYDTMVGTGLSGSLIIPILARAFDKHWLLIRKDNDGTHSCRIAEGNLGQRWIFVDDFISSGDTRDRVRTKVGQIAQTSGYGTTYVGDYLYQHSQFRANGEVPMPDASPFQVSSLTPRVDTVRWSA